MYDPSLLSTQHATISAHNRAELAPSNAWIVEDKFGRTTFEFLQTASTESLRDVFRAAATIPHDGAGHFILFHAVNAADQTQHTNSKLPNLHLHVFTSDFAAEFAHISAADEKSYVVQPNAHLASVVAAESAPQANSLQTIQLNKNNGGEIACHDIFMHKGYANFEDYIQNVNDAELETFRATMMNTLSPALQSEAGGARIVIDDRYSNIGHMAVQVLSGENMDRSGANKQRYFQKPSTPC